MFGFLYFSFLLQSETKRSKLLSASEVPLMWHAHKIRAALAAVSTFIWVCHCWTKSSLDWVLPFGSSSSADCRVWCLSSFCTETFFIILLAKGPWVFPLLTHTAVYFNCSARTHCLLCTVHLVQSSQESRRFSVCLLRRLGLKCIISYAGSKLW